MNALLAGVTFTPTTNFSGAFTIAIEVTDGVAAISGLKTMTGVVSGTTIITSAADTSADDGLCTLREAITASNTNTSSGTTSGECNGAHTLREYHYPRGHHCTMKPLVAIRGSGIGIAPVPTPITVLRKH